MLHLMKLAVGIRDLPHLRAVQAARLADSPPLCHRTRNFPRRAGEIRDGGSMYWVVSGAMLVRQRITDIIPSQWEDGSACAAILLDPVLVSLSGRPTKPFQGWRYLEPADAPPDLGQAPEPAGADAMPHAMRQELHRLGLL